MEKELQEELQREIDKLKELQKDRFRKTNFYDNYIYLSKRNIMDLMSLLRINNFKGARKVMKPQMRSLSIEEIKKQFSDLDIIDFIVCDVNIEKTIDNITMRLGYSEAMAKSVLRNLLEAYEYKTEDIEV